jgi:carboxylesterase
LRSPGSGDKSPIFSPSFATQRGQAVLCLHGLTGTPYEVAPLAHALAAAGYAVSAPLLAGHGESAATLAATRWQDWFAAAEAAFDGLRAVQSGGTVAVLGFSMGGLLALRMARLRPQHVSAVVALSVPLRLRTWQTAAAKAWRRLPAFLRRGPLATIRKRGGSDVIDTDARRENPSLPEMPIGSVAEVVDLAALVRRDLAFITQPVLVAHGEQDHTVDPKASYELAGSLAGPVVEQLRLSRSAHLIGVDVERSQLAHAVVQFLNKHRQPEAAASPESQPA